MLLLYTWRPFARHKQEAASIIDSSSCFSDLSDSSIFQNSMSRKSKEKTFTKMFFQGVRIKGCKDIWLN